MGDGGVDVLAVGLLCRRQAQAESSYDISSEVHDRSRDAHDPLGDLLDVEGIATLADPDKLRLEALDIGDGVGRESFEGEAVEQLGTAVAVHAGHEHPADRPVW